MLKCEKSHINRFLANKNLEALNDTNIAGFLNNLRLSNDTPLSDNYKISVLRTIKLRNKNITKRPRQLGYISNRTTGTKNYYTIKQTILQILGKVYALSTAVIEKLTSRSLIDTYIAILLTTSCNSSIEDLFALTKPNLATLVGQQFIIKKKKVTVHARLFALAFPLIEQLLHARSQLAKRINNNQVISCNPDIINKTVKILFIERCLLSNCTVFTENASQAIGLHKFKYKDTDVLLTYLANLGLVAA